MKIAIPTRNQFVDDHFGHCEFYTIVTVENNQAVKKEILEAPVGCGCKSNIAGILKGMGVDTMLAGNMGQGAVNKITQAGIDVLRGCSGLINEVVDSFLAGNVMDSGLTCKAHEGDHHHNHSHDDGHSCLH